MQLIKTIRSFGPAFKGVRNGFLSENNFKVHFLAAICVIILGWYLKVQRSDWLWLISAIGFVFTAEYLNTALEKLTDLISPGQNELAGKAKDLAAGAVLVASITALVIGVLVFWPYIFSH
jgi:diacylglycerol kinase